MVRVVFSLKNLVLWQHMWFLMAMQETDFYQTLLRLADLVVDRVETTSQQIIVFGHLKTSHPTCPLCLKLTYQINPYTTCLLRDLKCVRAATLAASATTPSWFSSASAVRFELTNPSKFGHTQAAVFLTLRHPGSNCKKSLH